METDKLSENGTQHDGDIGNSPSRAGTTHDESEVDEKATVKMAKLQKFTSLEDQQTRMPFRRLLQVYGCLGMALIISFMDQTSVSTAAPVIGTDLHGSASISWVGTAYYVSNCATHMVYGRLSDIFGRKVMLAVATGFLAFGNLLAGFAKTPVELYIFRAIGGMGGQGINSIAMVIISDIVSLKDRGKYQGLVAFFACFGNAIGSFLGGVLANAGQWRWVFWMTTILGAIVMVLDWIFLPLKNVRGPMSRKLKQIDYLGIFLSAAGTVFILVPVSGGGSTFNWKSATVIAMCIVGGLCYVAFIIWQWKGAALPILPLRIFNNRNTNAVMIQSFLIGMVYYANIFYVPIYFQYVRGYSPFTSGCYTLVQNFPPALWGIASGFYISKTSHYKRPIVIGAAMYVLGIGLEIRWNQFTPLGQILGVLQITALGVGWNLQTTLIAALATTATQDRAVVTTCRMFLRTLGGAFGLAMANSIYNNRVSAKLSGIQTLTPSQKTELLTSALAIKNLSGLQKVAVLDAYSEGTKAVFISITVLAGVNLICACFLKEVPFRKDSAELEAQKKKFRAKASDEKHVEEARQPEALELDEKAPIEPVKHELSPTSTLAERPLELIREEEPADTGSKESVVQPVVESMAHR